MVAWLHVASHCRRSYLWHIQQKDSSGVYHYHQLPTDDSKTLPTRESP
jgi:hypothetical protein